MFLVGVSMSSELKMILIKVAQADKELKEIDFEEGLNRYKSHLLKLAKDKTLDVIYTIEGSDQNDSNKDKGDLELLERAHLVKGETKYTHRNEYRQYMLTTEGAELAEKLSKENWYAQ